MQYEPGKAPILVNNQRVTVNFPDGTSLRGVIVGIASTDDTISPAYIVKCTDGRYPSPKYPYSTFVCPLGTIEMHESIKDN